MKDNILLRNNVNISGKGKQPMIFAPGFGCDQSVWKSVAESFEDDYLVVLFDYVGMGNSDIQAYEQNKYSTLSGYAQDILDVCTALDLKQAVLVGHSVGAMIGMIASIRQPESFSDLIMLGPSPCYLNHPPDYFGGFEKEELLGLIDMMEKNYLGWANVFASTLINNPDHPDAKSGLESRFCSTDPVMAHHFAMACFFGDNRKDLSKVTTPALILQCAEDVIAPPAVGEYLQRQLPASTLVQMEATGHCPHLSHPTETLRLMKEHLLNKNEEKTISMDTGKPV